MNALQWEGAAQTDGEARTLAASPRAWKGGLINVAGLGELMRQGIKGYGAPRAVWGMACETGPTEAVRLGLPLWLICSITQKTGTGQQGSGWSAGEGVPGFCQHPRSTYRSYCP